MKFIFVCFLLVIINIQMVQPSLTDYVTQSASAIPDTLKSTMAWTQLVKDSAWNSAKNTYNWASGKIVGATV